MAVKTAIVQVAARTSTGTQDFTVPGFGTPKLALFYVARATENGTPANGASIGNGAADGTKEWAFACSSLNNYGTTSCWRWGATDECILITDQNGNMDGEANWTSWITDGVRVTWGNAPAGAYLITCVLFNGSDFEAHVDTIEAAGSGASTATTNPGFEPDVVLFNGTGTSFSDSKSSGPCWWMGFAEKRGTIKNRCISSYHKNSASTSAVTLYVADDRCAVNIYPEDTISRSFDVTAFGANGFTVTHHSGGSSSSLWSAYVAMAFNGANDFWIGTIDTPTSTGNDAQTGPGFTPQFVLLGMADAAAIDTIYEQGEMAVSTFTADDKYCVGISDEDNLGTTNTQSLTHNQAVYVADDAGAVIYDAELVSMDANGWTLNFADTEGTVRKWIAFAIEEDGGAPPSGVPPLWHHYDKNIRSG